MGVYRAFNFILPIALLLLIQSGLNELAIVVALFSKWRVFTVKPRHLLANIRANAVDIIVKLSTLSFMIQSVDSTQQQLAWTAWYVVWLVIVKPGSTKAWVAVQAMTAQVLGLSALLYYSNSIAVSLIVLCAWVIGISTARHFIGSYEEKDALLISSIWGFFVMQLTWTLGKWLLVYEFVPQLVFILVVVSYTIASIYNAYKLGSLKAAFARQQIVIGVIILLAITVMGDWQGDI